MSRRRAIERFVDNIKSAKNFHYFARAFTIRGHIVSNESELREIGITLFSDDGRPLWGNKRIADCGIGDALAAKMCMWRHTNYWNIYKYVIVDKICYIPELPEMHFRSHEDVPAKLIERWYTPYVDEILAIRQLHILLPQPIAEEIESCMCGVIARRFLQPYKMKLAKWNTRVAFENEIAFTYIDMFGYIPPESSLLTLRGVSWEAAAIRLHRALIESVTSN